MRECDALGIRRWCGFMGRIWEGSAKFLEVGGGRCVLVDPWDGAVGELGTLDLIGRLECGGRVVAQIGDVARILRVEPCRLWIARATWFGPGNELYCWLY
jgi:hypothetical protein